MHHATVTRSVDLLLVVGPVDTLAVPATLTLQRSATRTRSPPPSTRA